MTVDQMLANQVKRIELTVDNLLDLRVKPTADKCLTILYPVK